MNKTVNKKRNLETFEFSIKASRELRRLKRQTGWTKKAIVERGIFAVAKEQAI